MFSYCADPKQLESIAWLSCYLTTNTHFSFYLSFITVIILLLVAAPLSLGFGFLGVFAKRSGYAPVRLVGNTYTNMVRGVPEIVFFMFVPIAMDQALELFNHKLIVCPDSVEPVYQGNDFVVCDQAKIPLNSAPQWIHNVYNFWLAATGFALVFGAFAANVIDGALNSVSSRQLETARAYGITERQTFWRVHLPQMWAYAIGGLSNLWMLLIKATPLLFLLGIEDIVYWAKALGGQKTSYYAYPHADWRVWYFLFLLIFYLGLTWLSGKLIDKITGRLLHGQATLAKQELAATKT